MGPKKVKGQPKQDDSTNAEVAQQVEQRSSKAGAQDNVKELSDLICSIIREEISVVINKFTTITDDVSACTRKLGVVDKTLPKLDCWVTDLEKECQTLCKANVEMRERAERLETHSRKSDLSDGIEKGNPTNYINMLLKELFKDKLTLELEVEIAYRIGPLGKSGGRAMITRLQNFTTKEKILEMAKKERMLQIHGIKLKIFPDLTTEMAKRRASFGKVAGVRHGIIHPAMLILTFEGETKKFTESMEAEMYYKTLIKLVAKNKDQ